MKLTATNVHDVVRRCLYRDDELDGRDTPPEGAVIVEGVVRKFAFNPDRLRGERSNVASMLDCLDDKFKTKGGGGLSFLQACVTKDDEHWGEHSSMEALFALGMGLGIVIYTMPREFWPVLPGSMPYLTIDSDALSVPA